MKKFYVKIQHPAISEAIQKIAFENGYNWCNKPNQPEVMHTDKEHLVFYPEERKIYTSLDPNKNFQIFEVDDAVRQLTEKLMKIGEHNVKFATNGSYIKVGCQTVTFNQVVEIYEEMKKRQES